MIELPAYIDHPAEELAELRQSQSKRLFPPHRRHTAGLRVSGLTLRRCARKSPEEPAVPLAAAVSQPKDYQALTTNDYSCSAA